MRYIDHAVHMVALALLVAQSPVFAALAPEEIFDRASPSVVIVISSTGVDGFQGSGVVTKFEHVVTNCHILVGEAGQPSIKVLVGTQQFPAMLVVADAAHDLCELLVPGLRSRPAKIGTSANLRVGQRVYAIGSPRGLERTLSDGLVSAIRPFENYNLIQTTAPITHGSSGGGLFDDSGLLIGITSSGIDSGQNLNFAIPIDLAKSLSSSIVTSRAPDSAVSNEETIDPDLVDSARLSVSTAISPANMVQPDPEPQFSSTAEQFKYSLWIGEIEGRLATKIPDPHKRHELVSTVWYESKRAGVDPNLVLAIIATGSRFNSLGTSGGGRGRGYMQVSTFWVALIGDGDVKKLAYTKVNLRYGCNVLRMNIDQEKGDLILALGRYHGTRGNPKFPEMVLAAWKEWVYVPK